MSWQLLIGISVIFSAISLIFQKNILRYKKINPIVFSIFFQFITGLILFIYGGINHKIVFPPIQSLFINLIFMTVLYGFGNIFMFKALQLIDVSKFTIIFSNRIFFVVLASSILLGEGLIVSQFIGLLLIIFAVILIHFTNFRVQFHKGDLYAFLAAFLIGLALTNDRFLLKFFNIYTYTFINFMFPSLLCAGFYFSQLRDLKYLFKFKILIKTFILCVVVAIFVLCFFLALQVGNNSSQIASLSLTNIIIAVLLSIIILHEKENIIKKIIAAVLSLIGALLLS